VIQRVLGIDPGLAVTGWGIIDSSGTRHTHIDHGTIATAAGDSPALRLQSLYRELSALMAAFKPQGMGIETLFFTKNISSAIPVAQARGVVLLAAAEHNLTVGEFSPVTIKQSVVGAGGAEKKQVQEMVRLLLGLKEIPKPDHSADALAAAITFLHHGSLWLTASAAH
jgi:crossover junction endodeoxyribonuclease RuvC